MEKEISLTVDNEMESEGFEKEREVRRSIVAVKFKGIYKPYSYFNDKYELRVGDKVYVSGKLSGNIGTVVDIDYNFKINLDKYQKVIGIVDTSVKGSFYSLGDDYLISFDKKALNAEKVAAWFNGPLSEKDVYVTGSDDSKIDLEDIEIMDVDRDSVINGIYFCEHNSIKYLSVNGNNGYCLIDDEGDINNVEFNYCCNKVSNLTCDCYRTGLCFHKYAALLKLKEVSVHIKENYQEEYEENKFFAIIDKTTLLNKALNDNSNQKITIE